MEHIASHLGVTRYEALVTVMLKRGGERLQGVEGGDRGEGGGHAKREPERSAVF